MIRYVNGDATCPLDNGPKAIVHCCNDIGAWGAGFTYGLTKRWKAPRNRYSAWFTSRVNFELGEIQLVEVEPDIVVVNLIGQHGVIGFSGDDVPDSVCQEPPIRYAAIRNGLKKVNEALTPEYSIHMPRIGCGLAGGEWKKVEEIINDELKDRLVTVYDYP